MIERGPVLSRRLTSPTLSKALSAVALVAVLGITMAGCSSTSTETTKAPTKSAAPVVTPSASATAEPKDVLFTITANVRGKDGSTIGIQLTAHEPIVSTESSAKTLQTEFLGECGGGVGGIPVTADTLATNGSILMGIDLAASVSGKPFAYPLDLAVGSQNFAQAAKGTGITEGDASSPCYGVPSHRWSTAGPAHAVADFESGSPGPDTESWRYGQYGFSVPFDSNTTIEACKVTLTTLATDAGVTEIDGWDPTTAATGTTCLIGHVGE
jgi:hypothetical protein